MVPKAFLSPSKDLLAVQQQGDRAVVDQAHLHHLAEAAGGDLEAVAGQGGGQVCVELFRHFRGRGASEGGAAALAAVAQDGELGDQQQFEAGIQEREVQQAAVLTGKDPEVGQFLGQKGHVGGAVVGRHSGQDQESRSDPGDSAAPIRTQASWTRCTTARIIAPVLSFEYFGFL